MAFLEEKEKNIGEEKKGKKKKEKEKTRNSSSQKNNQLNRSRSGSMKEQQARNQKGRGSLFAGHDLLRLRVVLEEQVPQFLVIQLFRVQQRRRRFHSSVGLERERESINVGE